MNALSIYLFCITTLLLSGCAIPVAPFYDQPLPNDQIDQLKPGATQDDVIRLLGDPDTTRQDGRFWYYGGTRPSVLIIGPNDIGAFKDYRWIEVGFDDELRLLYVDPQESKTGCSRSGHCFRNWWVELKDKKILDSTVIMDSLENDKIAKMFNAPEGGCAIYIYYEPQGFLDLLGMDTSPSVDVNGSREIWMDGDTYMRFNVLTGPVGINYGRIIKKEWECQAGNVVYLVKKQFLKTKPSPDELQFVDASIGMKEISKRRLLLSP